jgi:hypothetical protein
MVAKGIPHIDAGLGFPVNRSEKITEMTARIEAHDDPAYAQWFKGYTPPSSILTPLVANFATAEKNMLTDRNAGPARDAAERAATEKFDDLLSFDVTVARANPGQAHAILTAARVKIYTAAVHGPVVPHVEVRNGAPWLILPAYQGNDACTYENHITSDGGQTYGALESYSGREMLLVGPFTSGKSYGVGWRLKTGPLSKVTTWSAAILFNAP